MSNPNKTRAAILEALSSLEGLTGNTTLVNTTLVNPTPEPQPEPPADTYLEIEIHVPGAVDPDIEEVIEQGEAIGRMIGIGEDILKETASRWRRLKSPSVVLQTGRHLTLRESLGIAARVAESVREKAGAKIPLNTTVRVFNAS